jgi:hypothetical protein
MCPGISSSSLLHPSPANTGQTAQCKHHQTTIANTHPESIASTPENHSYLPLVAVGDVLPVTQTSKQAHEIMSLPSSILTSSLMVQRFKPKNEGDIIADVHQHRQSSLAEIQNTCS